MKSIDISGMGGAYEDACQVMLLRGMKFLNQHPMFDFGKYKIYKGVYGICEGEGERCKELDKCITKDIDPTGAMHQAVIGHLAHIHKKGYIKFIENVSEKEPRRIIEVGTLEELEQKVKDYFAKREVERGGK